MAQWFAAKAAHPDALLFFRMGDFYELFFADAETAAAALDITLSHRGTHDGKPIQMCGVPHHAADAYLARLIRRGFRVAVAEQTEDSRTRTGKGPIPRAVVRVVTPGTLTEDSLLEAGRTNLLLALAPVGTEIGAAWLDASTGLFETSCLPVAGLPGLLARLDPAEIVAAGEPPLGEHASRRAPAPAAAQPAIARRRIAEAFAAASLDAFGTFSDAEAIAAALAIDYLRGTSGGRLPRLSRPAPQGAAGRMEIDPATRASLELFAARDGGGRHTLLAAVSRTLTASGGRLLATRIGAPLTDPAIIATRQDAWAWLLTLPALTADLRAALRRCPDIERALARLSLARGGPRDLAAIRDSLTAAATIAAALDGPLPAALATARATLAPAPGLAAILAAALAGTLPARGEEGVIAPGFDGELDAHRALRDDSRKVLATLQLDFAQRYGVASLKIRHHAQLGYVLEAPAAAAEKLRTQSDLILRQSTATGARFGHPRLADLDRRITEAAENASTREATVLAALTAQALAAADGLAAAAAALAELDVAQSAAALAAGTTPWCRPEVTDDAAFTVTAGRHPVVEAALAGSTAFVPNDCGLSPGRRLLLLTGPNMAGKSTFLRQNALIAVLAQAGLPVPATAARIGVVDRLFSRVGAADDLARGRSTFMVEMVETAAILHQAGPRSLVIVDEIGRGTATLDGLAIAWAVLEALHNTARCRTIFATHFHELAGLGPELPELSPHAMRVRAWKGSVVFLHEVAAGAAGRSWGVQVAGLAGVPAPVVRRAGALLAALEQRAGRLTDAGTLPLFAATPEPGPVDPLAAALDAMDPNTMAPREALDAIYALKTLRTVASGDGDG